MSLSDYEREYLDLIQHVNLRQGEHFLDAQTEADSVSKIVASGIAPYGQVVGLVYGKKKELAINQNMQKTYVENLKVNIGHVTKLPFPSNQFMGAIYRKARNFNNADIVISESIRVSKPGAKIIYCYLNWNINWIKEIPSEYTEMVDKLCRGAFDCPEVFIQKILSEKWYDLQMDTYDLAGNKKSHKYLYKQDWRYLLKQFLHVEHYIPIEEVQSLIGYIETKKIEISVQRFVAIAQK